MSSAAILFGALRVNDWAKGYIAYQVGRSFIQIFYLFFRFVVVVVQIIVCIYFCLLISEDIL